MPRDSRMVREWNLNKYETIQLLMGLEVLAVVNGRSSCWKLPPVSWGRIGTCPLRTSSTSSRLHLPHLNRAKATPMMLDIQSIITDQQSVLKHPTAPSEAEPGIGRLTTVGHFFVNITRASASPATSSSSIPLGNSNIKDA